MSGTEITVSGDVVVERATDLTVRDAEDVFVDRQPQAVVEVRSAEDVYADGDTVDPYDVYRDEVVDERGATVRNVEDVHVTARAVTGTLRVENAEDVHVRDPRDAEFTAVEDVFLKRGAVGPMDQVVVSDAHDVHLEEESVDGRLSATNPEWVRVPDEKVVEPGASTGVVELEGVEDVILNSVDAVTAVHTSGEDRVEEVDDGWLPF